MDPSRCKEKVSDHTGFHFYQCSRKAKIEGYCKQHHPDTIAEKAKRSQEKWDAEWELQKLRLAGPDAVQVIKDIYENRPTDPVVLCQRFLEEHDLL